MPLELDSLRKAIAALSALLAKSQDETYMESQDEVARAGLKSGVIQNFQLTYELCYRFMRRWLEANTNRSLMAGITRKQLFRLAAQNALIDDVDRWWRHTESRNKTVHTYDEQVAEEVYAAVPAFKSDAEWLLKRLEAAND